MAGAQRADAGTPRHALQRWLAIDEKSKPAICAQIYATAEIASLNYWLEIVFSAGIASLGLVLNSPAVIIGAMLISPLMGPIMATGLALAAGDLYLGMKAGLNLAASIVLAILLSGLMVWLLPFHSVTPEVLSRINPTLLDLGVALFSGLAGSVAISRAGGGGAITLLPGVAIAVALMPPLCTMGFGLGTGANTRIMGGAGLLFLTNLVAIVSSAFVVFLLIGMNSAEVRAELTQLQSGERLAGKIARTRWARALNSGGQLRWRVLMLVVVLAAIALPLRTALKQLAGEAVARGAAEDVMRNLLPPGALVSQQIEVGRGNMAIRLVSTEGVPAARLEEARREIERRSGQKVELSVSTVASQSSLVDLMARLSTPPAPPPKPPELTLPQIYEKVMDRLGPVMQTVWPPEAPLQDYEIGFGATGMVLHVRYTAARPLGEIPLNMIERECEEKLGLPGLKLETERVRAAPVRRK